MKVEARIDQLYSLPLSEFVAARNALAKELRAGGDRERADAVKALAKPSVPAWVVNRLWHAERDSFDRLLDAGSAVRAAVGAGKGQREAAARRSEAAKSLVGLARKLLSESGHPTTPAVLQKVSHTLDAVAALGLERLDPPPGRLSRDLEPPGFDFLAGLQLPPAAKRPARAGAKRAKKPSAAKSTRKRAKPAPAAPDQKNAKQVAAARQALEESRAALASAKRQAEELEREVEAASKRAVEAAEAAKRAEEAAATARRAAQDAGERLAEAGSAEKEAAKAARAARTAVRRASAKVKAGENRLAKLAG